jgi:hypothetical protein
MLMLTKRELDGYPQADMQASARMFVAVPAAMLMRMPFPSSTLTGRIGWHSTTGLAVVAAARLAAAELDERVGRGQPQLLSERGVVAGPIGEHGRRAWSRL